MIEKQYTIVNMGLDGQYIKENGKIMTIERVVDLLNENEQYKILTNELKRQNKKLKARLNDLGVEYYD